MSVGDADDRIVLIGRLVAEILAERTDVPPGEWFLLADNEWAITSDGEVSSPSGPVEGSPQI